MTVEPTETSIVVNAVGVTISLSNEEAKNLVLVLQRIGGKAAGPREMFTTLGEKISKTLRIEYPNMKEKDRVSGRLTWED